VIDYSLFLRKSACSESTEREYFEFSDVTWGAFYIDFGSFGFVSVQMRRIWMLLSPKGGSPRLARFRFVQSIMVA
jgi:hypothetical protein